MVAATATEMRGFLEEGARDASSVGGAAQAAEEAAGGGVLFLDLDAGV